MSDNFDKLNDLLGFDAAKRTSLGGVLKDSLAEVVAEREEKARTECKAVILEAIGVAEQAKQAERQFASAQKKFNKQLGKLLGRLQGGGQPQEEEGDEDTEE